MKFLVVIYPKPPQKPALAQVRCAPAQQTTTWTNASTVLPRVKKVDASDHADAAERAGVQPGEHALVVALTDAVRFDRPDVAPLARKKAA